MRVPVGLVSGRNRALRTFIFSTRSDLYFIILNFGTYVTENLIKLSYEWRKYCDKFLANHINLSACLQASRGEVLTIAKVLRVSRVSSIRPKKCQFCLKKC